eukprot:CAMPEP_0180810660 /NCGR_PEP_ID=MMETSP1038_2-20121128/65009_1 /TAXON_ID=632150 /ORGANISM="Azadinium spinosum, Strain 3D9" /LENGTH=36 /DNA_ID= /DNA_START= /DNA_END= /DNA_ORIENTATION=
MAGQCPSPRLSLVVEGHQEVGNHTVYGLRCTLQAPG